MPRARVLERRILAMLGLVALAASCGRSLAIECVDAGECADGLFCSANGMCMRPQAVCASDRECGLQFRCVEFECVSKDICATDSECRTGNRCVFADPSARWGICRAPFTCEPGCPQGSYCAKDLRCVEEGKCGSDLDCAAAERCTFGNCVVTTCSDDEACAPDRSCEAKQCLRQVRCDWDQECPTDMECIDKVCAPAEGCGHCEPFQVCIANKCIPTGKVEVR